MLYNKVYRYLNELSPDYIKWGIADERGTWAASYTSDWLNPPIIFYFYLGDYKIGNDYIDTKDPFIDWDLVDMPDITEENLDDVITKANDLVNKEIRKRGLKA